MPRTVKLDIVENEALVKALYECSIKYHSNSFPEISRSIKIMGYKYHGWNSYPTKEELLQSAKNYIFVDNSIIVVYKFKNSWYYTRWEKYD